MDARSVGSVGCDLCMATVALEVVLHQAKIDIDRYRYISH